MLSSTLRILWLGIACAATYWLFAVLFQAASAGCAARGFEDWSQAYASAGLLWMVFAPFGFVYVIAAVAAPSR